MLAIQFVALMVLAVHSYDRFALSRSYAIFDQAWFEIAHGNLNPVITTTGSPFWRDHFALIMWPLGLLFWLSPNDGLTLLTLQNLAAVVGEGFALAWVVALARARSLSWTMTASCVAAALCLFVVNPWSYLAATENFHFQTLAACCTMATGYYLWLGRRRAMWVWVAIALLTGDVAGTYIFGLGFAFAVSTPRCRRTALALAGVGIAWVGFVALIGANRGSAIDQFAYMAGGPVHQGLQGVIAVTRGGLTHPARPLDMLRSHRQFIADNLTPTGFLGLFNPWMFGPILVVLVSNSLNSSSAFAGPGFQSAPVYLFGIAGTTMTAVLLVGWRSIRTGIVSGLLATVVAVAAIFAVKEARPSTIIPNWVGASTASQLQSVRTASPNDAEVVISGGVVGRFAGRRYEYIMTGPRMSVPVRSTIVLFVFVPLATPFSERQVASMRTYVTDHLNSMAIARGPNVWAYLWHPPPGTREIVLGG